jgi:protein SCO1/2
MPRIEASGSLAGIRKWLWIAVAAALVGAVGVYFWSAQRASAPVTETYASAFGGPFKMTDTAGKSFSSDQLKGKPFTIFFGFTRCPDVCPTTLSRMAVLRKKLGADGDKFNIVFVTVDPARDTVPELAQYLTLFGTPIIGLTGTAEQTAQVVKAYHVFYEKVPTGPGDYTIDHTATVYLMGRNGEFVTTIDHQENEATALDKLRRVIAEG